jgi:hypothetical protein
MEKNRVHHTYGLVSKLELPNWHSSTLLIMDKSILGIKPLDKKFPGTIPERVHRYNYMNICV